LSLSFSPSIFLSIWSSSACRRRCCRRRCCSRRCCRRFRTCRCSHRVARSTRSECHVTGKSCEEGKGERAGWR
jgi:hypothetical protein